MKLKNFRYFIDAYNALLKYVKDELDKIKAKQLWQKATEKATDNNNQSTFQEMYELAQRKFLRQLIQFCDNSDSIKAFPRLILVDLVDRTKLNALVTRINDSYLNGKEDEKEEGGEIGTKKHDESVENLDVNNVNDANTSKLSNKSEQKSKQNENISSTTQYMIDNDDIYFIGNMPEYQRILHTTSTDYITGYRILCEHEEGWHQTKCFIPFSDIESTYSPFLTRVMNLIKKYVDLP